MRANTIIMIVLAAVFGIVAVVLANMWLADQRNAIAAVNPEAPKDTIVVAAVPIKFGDELSADKLREIAWPAGALPAGSFRTTGELLDKDKGNRQALQAIGVNEPILAAKITGPGFEEDGVVDAVERAIECYRAQRQPGERFLDTYRRVGFDTFKEAIYG